MCRHREPPGPQKTPALHPAFQQWLSSAYGKVVHILSDVAHSDTFTLAKLGACAQLCDVEDVRLLAIWQFLSDK